MCNVTGLHNSKAAIRHNLNPVEAGGEAGAAIKAAQIRHTSSAHFFLSYLFSSFCCWLLDSLNVERVPLQLARHTPSAEGFEPGLYWKLE